MKKIFATLFLTTVCPLVFGQSSTGLIAHWDMNGSASDVTGNGHNGHLFNVVPVPGESGLPNTAYYFNGVNSVITAPYLPDLNLVTYSICATLNVDGFFSGYCQTNTVIARGRLATNGNYSLIFYDNPYDGDDCSAIDSTKDVFICEYGTYYAPIADWQYSPQISRDAWYKVVATWDGTNRKIYVNGILKSTAPSSGGTTGSSTDSIAIGMDIFESWMANDYMFKGSIDDIRLYNRVLSDSEISVYSTDCGTIVTQPHADTTESGGTAAFSLATTMSAPIYQWQEDFGTGFINLINVPPYSGVYTPTLTITGAMPGLNNTHYRCLINNSNCHDTTVVSTLIVRNALSLGTASSGGSIRIFPNPASDIVHIQLTGQFATVLFEVYNAYGQIVLSQESGSQGTDLNTSVLPSGVYYVKALTNAGYYVTKFTRM